MICYIYLFFQSEQHSSGGIYCSGHTPDPKIVEKKNQRQSRKLAQQEKNLKLKHIIKNKTQKNNNNNNKDVSNNETSDSDNRQNNNNNIHQETQIEHFQSNETSEINIINADLNSGDNTSDAFRYLNSSNNQRNVKIHISMSNFGLNNSNNTTNQ